LGIDRSTFREKEELVKALLWAMDVDIPDDSSSWNTSMLGQLLQRQTGIQKTGNVDLLRTPLLAWIGDSAPPPPER
jgi:hypothetical protein